ncbi:MAG: tRNA1(Val) (adenine(37)-N6)-methyltransferase [Lachnospiraceae bacterium]
MIYEDERIDDLQCKGYKIIQKPKGFCFGMDAVLLSNFANVKKGQKVLDLCTGSGVVPLLLAGHTDAEKIYGLEIQEEYADMANRSVCLNQLEQRITITRGDVKEIKNIYTPASFSVVTANPPYMTHHHGLENDYEPKTIARHEVLLSLEDVVAGASYVLKQKGCFYLIHKPFRLAEIIRIMKAYHLEPKRIRFVHPYIDKEPTMVLIEGVKGGKERVTIEPPLIVYQGKNQYTKEIYDIYHMK